MIEAGVLEGVDAALGLHVWAPLPSGVVGVVPGPFMASAAEFRVTVRGRGGHGAMPHQAVDALLVGSQIVVALQSVVARTVDPLDSAVVTVAAFEAGEAFNVIAETAKLIGTVRAFDPELVRALPERIERIVAGICSAMGADYAWRYELRTPPTTNDPELAELVRATATAVLGAERVRADAGVRTMAAEDFGEFLQRVPGCFFFIGCGDEESGANHPHHSPRFDICENALPLAVDVLERVALEYLNGTPVAGVER